jgi:hypothetical protein
VRAAAQLAHGQVVEDPLLDVLEVVVVLVEDPPRHLQIQRVLAGRRPRQLHQPVDVRAQHRRLGALGVHLVQAADLLVRLGASLVGQAGARHLGPQLIDLLAVHVAVAELVLDLPQLLAQVVVALGLGHLLAGAVLDLRLHLQDADLLLQRLVHPLQAQHRLVQLQQLLRLGHLERQVRGHQVGHPPGVLDALDHHRHLGLDRLAQARQLVDVAAHRAEQRLQAHRAHRRAVVRAIDAHPVARALRHEALDLGAAEPLHQHLEAALGELAHAHDHPDRARAVERRRARVVLARVALRDQEAEALVRLQRLGHRLHRHRPRHPQRNDHVREDDKIADGEQRQDVWNLGIRQSGLAPLAIRGHADTVPEIWRRCCRMCRRPLSHISVLILWRTHQRDRTCAQRPHAAEVIDGRVAHLSVDDRRGR